MCGRIKQARNPEEYHQHIRWHPRSALDVPGLRFNVPPGTRPMVLHRVGDGGELPDRLFWATNLLGTSAARRPTPGSTQSSSARPSGALP